MDERRTCVSADEAYQLSAPCTGQRVQTPQSDHMKIPDIIKDVSVRDNRWWQDVVIRNTAIGQMSLSVKVYVAFVMPFKQELL
jgi:hypothetical protein